MSERSRQTEDKYVLRMPEGMRDEIKAEAERTKRSMNAEIVYRLQMSLLATQSPSQQPSLFGGFEPETDPYDDLSEQKLIKAIESHTKAIQDCLRELDHARKLRLMFGDVRPADQQDEKVMRSTHTFGSDPDEKVVRSTHTLGGERDGNSHDAGMASSKAAPRSKGARSAGTLSQKRPRNSKDGEGSK